MVKQNKSNLEAIIEVMSRASGLDTKDWLRRAFPEHAECPMCEKPREFIVVTQGDDQGSEKWNGMEILEVRCARCNTLETVICGYADGTMSHVASH